MARLTAKQKIELLRSAIIHASFTLTMKARFVEADRIWSGEQFKGDVYGVKRNDWKDVHKMFDEALHAIATDDYTVLQDRDKLLEQQFNERKAANVS